MDKEQLLYNYFTNSLTEEQEKQFKELLEKDTEFKSEFEFEYNLKRVAKEKRQADLKAKLRNFESGLNTEEKEEKSSFNYLKIAASVVLLITASWLGYQSFFSLDYNDLYADNFKTYPNTVFTITRSDSLNSLEREAFVAYESHDYKLALEKFKQAKQQNYFTFYEAQCYLRLNKFNEAINKFNLIIKQNEEFVPESYWYAALAYLKQQNKEKVIHYLNKLVSDFNYKKEETKQLLEDLN